MKVLRIVANIAAPDPAEARRFYGKLLGLEALMDPFGKLVNILSHR